MATVSCHGWVKPRMLEHIMCIRGEARMDVIRQCVDAYLTVGGEPARRRLCIDLHGRTIVKDLAQQ